MHRVPCIVVVGLLLVPGRAAGQGAWGSWYVQGGVAVALANGPSGDTYEIYLAAPGGTSTEFLFAAGFHVSRHISIEGEAGTTGTMRARELSRYDLIYNEERREVFLGANVRFHACRGCRFGIDPLAGIGLIRYGGSSRTDTNRRYPPEYVVGPTQSYDPLNAMALTFGVDFPLGASRVRFVPSFRVRLRAFTPKADPNSPIYREDLWSRYPGGVPEHTIAFGANLRVDF